MYQTIAITANDSFHIWQKKMQRLFWEMKAEQTAMINAAYADIIEDYKLCRAASKRFVDHFHSFVNSQPLKYSREADHDIALAHASVKAEVERINNEFEQKWGYRYLEYRQAVAALEQEHRKALAFTRSSVAYKQAMANLAGKNYKGGFTHV
jgi:hypothetical protein